MLFTESNIFVLDYLYNKKTPFAISAYFELQCSVPFHFCFSLVNTILARRFNETVRFCYEFVCLVSPTVKPKQQLQQFELSPNDKEN